MSLTQERLKELLHYDPESGIFTRLVRTSNRTQINEIAGSNNGNGYLRICVDGTKYYTHRLAWLYMTGEWPTDQGDHKNTIPSDNRWTNLRDATPAINSQNQRKAKSNSSTGFLGVFPCGKRFKTQVGLDERSQHVGVYDTPELAYEAYVDAKRKLHPGCTL